VRVAVVDASTTRPLRRAVLRPSWPEDATMHGDQYPDAVHFAVLDGEAVVSACLVLPRPYPRRPHEPDAWQLRGMATAQAYRNRGLGAQLLAAVFDHLNSLSAHIVWCEARTSAMAFYARHGFQVDGPEFLHEETGIPHYHMWRALA
jgi:predicted GNAT family N-acyltransferase